MNLPINRGLQTYFLTQAESDTYPVVTVNNTEMIVPTFITQELKEVNNEVTSEKTTKLVYKYYPVTLLYKGDDITKPAQIIRMRWDEFREWFYGPQWVQSEMESKGLWTAHAMAVRAVFAKVEGEIPTALKNFWEAYTNFWTLLAGVCLQYGIPYKEIPSEFDSSYLLTMAEKYGITGDTLSLLMVRIQLIVFDIIANKYVWKNLFPKPNESEFLQLVK